MIEATPEMVSRAQGCLLGQLAGDALGSLVEFRSPADIRRQYPDGVRELADGGTWDTLAGQPTDDSEMALALARSLVRDGRYAAKAARAAYVDWLHSDPFDVGNTVSAGLSGRVNRESQANGALMRISPLGIFCARREPDEALAWAKADAELTHPHPVCVQANQLFVAAIARAIREGCVGTALYQDVLERATNTPVAALLLAVIRNAASAPPADYVHQQGWVLIAFHNALWQLLHAPTLEAGVVDTVMQGGDTDTNAAIAGAVLGAVHGREAVPAQWVDRMLNCRPKAGDPRVRHPRPEHFWPVDALELAEQLVSG
jgi:ADP-ribosyl-[dinitrogen reductase] hydrolase